MRLDVVTIFPDYLAPLGLSLIGKAREDGLLDVRVHDLREHTHDRHRTVDDTPYGGGAGMVMKPEPWGEALDAVLASDPTRRPTLVVPGPGGERFTQAIAEELAESEWIVFACGRYEGIDERVYEEYAERLGEGGLRVLSLGDYVLNGGEVAVLAMTEAIVRLVPGVIGNAESLTEESHTDGLLEYPLYTKPPLWRGREVPDVLRSGDHGRIAQWRLAQRRARTAARRPDLLHPSVTLAGTGEQLPLELAGPGDAAEIHTMTRACWLREVQLNGDLGIPPVVETLDDAVADLQPGSPWRTWVLRDSQTRRLVGSVRGRVEADGAWEVGRLMVAPDLGGRGLGRALLEFGLAAAPEGTRVARLTAGARSDRNQRIYKKAGFRVVGSLGGEHAAVVMEKRLRG